MLRAALKIVVALLVVSVAGIASLALINDYDINSRGDVVTEAASMSILRTPEERFAELADFPFQPHYLTIDDPDLGELRVHYLDEGPADGAGNGETIVLLHGQATWSYSFRKMIPLLTSAGYRVIAPDFVGFGRSDKPANWKDHTFKKHTVWLDKTLSALNVEGATGFLFDWGGYFALRVLADKPELFSRVVLCTTTMPRANSLFGAVWVALWRRRVLTPEVFPISSMVGEMTHNGISEETVKGLDAPYPDETYKAGPRRFPMMIPATLLNPATIDNREAWKKLKNWNGPAITLVSELNAKRGFNPQEFYDQLSGTAGQAHQTYPDTSFFIIEEIPEELAEQTLAFIKANP